MSKQNSIDLAQWQDFFDMANKVMRLPSAQKEEDWVLFFQDFARAFSHGTGPEKTEISLEAADLFFTEVRTAYDEWHESGGAVNVWQVAKVGSDEVRNSQILAWLLDMHGSHGQGALFLKAFLSQCDESKETKDILQLLERCPDYTTRTEWCQHGDNSNRLDIVCLGKGNSFALYIEVKIHAVEGLEQTRRYVEQAKTHVGENGLWKVVFLARRDDKALSSDEVDKVTWRNLRKSLYEASKDLDKKSILVAEVVRQYVYHMNTFN